MRKFRVSVNMVRCCDVYLDAETVEDAKEKVLACQLWREEGADAWCDGHKGTEQVDDAVEVDDNGNEV